MDLLFQIIANSAFLALLVWILLNQVNRINKHDDEIKELYELISANQQNTAILLERTKGL